MARKKTVIDPLAKKVPVRYQGANFRRTEAKANKLELAFALEWEHVNRLARGACSPPGEPRLLHGILGNDFPDRHEEHVAATMIQWLGTPVGQAFICNAMERAGKL